MNKPLVIHQRSNDSKLITELMPSGCMQIKSVPVKVDKVELHYENEAGETLSDESVDEIVKSELNRGRPVIICKVVTNSNKHLFNKINQQHDSAICTSTTTNL